MLLNLEKDAEMPLYRQIADQIRTNIGSGTLAPGYRLPTVRELAYAELQSEGFIESVVGRGTFVAEQLPVQITRKPIAIRQRADMPVVWYSQNLFAAMLKLSQKPGVISFSQAAPGTDAMPGRELSRALQEAAADPAAFAYGTPQGAPELRHEIAALLLDRGIAATPDDIMITSGAQQAVDLGFRAFLEPEDLLAVEEPSYPGMVAIAAGRRQRVVGVPVDNEGLNVERLAEICEVYRPALLYTIPTFHNPTGVSLSPARREQLLDLAEKYDFLIMEDDVYGLLSYDGYSPPALKAADNRQRVVYISSFSKILAPGLRIGVMVAQPAITPTRLGELFASPPFAATFGTCSDAPPGTARPRGKSGAKVSTGLQNAASQRWFVFMAGTAGRRGRARILPGSYRARRRNFAGTGVYGTSAWRRKRSCRTFSAGL
jgi:2-aminoadipate transaminase